MGHGGTGADAYLCMDYISFVLSPSPYPSFHPHPTPRFNPPPPLTSTPLPPFTPAPARNYKEAGRLNEELKAKVAKEKELAVEVDSLLASSEATSLRLDDVKRQLSATKEEVTRREQEEGKGGERREVRLLHMVTLSVAMLTVAWRGIREEGAHSAALLSDKLNTLPDIYPNQEPYTVSYCGQFPSLRVCVLDQPAQGGAS